MTDQEFISAIDSAGIDCEPESAFAIKALLERSPLANPHLQELFSSTIIGALMSGHQSAKPPPEGHWLEGFYRIGLAEAKRFAAGVTLAPQRANRVYIAGPMTGIADYNFPAFNEAAALLRSAALHVENPAEHGIVEGAEWGDYLRYDIGRLATCEAIYLLPGWSCSKGASLELCIAGDLDMRIMFAPGAERSAAAPIPTCSEPDHVPAGRSYQGKS